MRISSTTLKFTRELSRKDGTRNRYRSDTDTGGFPSLHIPFSLPATINIRIHFEK